MKLRQTALLCALLAGTTGAVAHDVWLLPSSTVLSKPSYITLDAAVSNQTFHFEHRPLAIGDNLVVRAPDGSTVAPESLVQGKLRTVFDLNLEQTGTYRIAAVHSGLFASWKADGENRRWRGKAEDLDKDVPAEAEGLVVRESVGRLETFVTVGAPQALEPIGKGLELMPVTHPNDLFAGEEAVFRFLVDGKPAAGIEVAIVRGGTRYRNELEKVELKTDEAGEIRFTWPQAGQYWLDADSQDQLTSHPRAKDRRLSYTATFEVLPQ